MSANDPVSDQTKFWIDSHNLYQSSRLSEPGIIHAKDPAALFHCIQAKRTGLCFQHTKFTFDSNDDPDFIDRQDLINPLNAIKYNYMRQYSLTRHNTEWNISSSKPLVSVCIPYYNAGEWFTDALNSLLANDYEKTEIIIVDDGSDIPLSIELRDISVLRKANGGPSSARNYAANNARGEYLLFCDADNIFYPNMISQMVESALRSGCDCLTPYLERFSETFRDVWTPIGACVEYAFFANSLGDSNMIIRADVFHNLGGFNEKLKGFEDWELLARLVLSGYDYDVIPEPLVRYRVRPDGVGAGADLYAGRLAITKVYQDYFISNTDFFSRFCIDAYNALEVKETERTKAYLEAVGELERANEKAAEVLRKAHEAAGAVLKQAHETAGAELKQAHESAVRETELAHIAVLNEIATAKEKAKLLFTVRGSIRWLKSRLLSRFTM